MNQKEILKNELVEIGALIKMLRKREKIKQTELFEGLCTKEVFERIETGKDFTNELLLERLFSRLHMQYRLLELTLSDDDFARKELRSKIELCVEKQQAERAEELLRQYAAMKKCGKLEEQYILWMRARMLENGKRQEAGEMYRQAFMMTGENVERRLLSVEELEMYHGYRRCLKPLAKAEQEDWLFWMENELFQRQIYPSSYFIIQREEAEKRYAASQWEAALEICRKCIEVLNSRNKSYFLTEFLFLQAKCRERLKAESKEETYEEFRMVYYTSIAFGEEIFAEKVAVYCEEELGWHITDVVK